MSAISLEDRKAQLREFIVNDDIPGALALLRKYLSADSESYAMFSAQETNFYLRERAHLAGALREEDFQLVHQETAMALLQLIDRLRPEDLQL